MASREAIERSLNAALGDRYAIEREVGRGGMATVYLAEDLKHRRKVAVKILDPDLAAALGGERFLREIETAAHLAHPHILPLHDSGEAGGFLFYVMPYVAGESLRQRLDREGPLPVEEALRIVRDAAEALKHAHGLGVIHRDIKPENILLDSGHAIVADFGIARAIDRADARSLTVTSAGPGTPAYMSPEQAAGARDLDGRSDLYGLACVLFEMLAGEPPFTGPTAGSLIAQRLTTDAPPVSDRRSGVPPHVVAALRKALAREPADRFESVSEFAEALEVGRGAPGRGTPRGPVTWKRAVLAAAAIVVLAGAATLGRWGPSGERELAASGRSAIAVLPLQNLSGDGPNAYFAGGLHSELLTQLGKVQTLTVMGRSSVLAWASTGRPLGEIAAELGVGSVLEGSVQVLGDRLRVNVQLLDVATGRQVWSDGFDQTLDDAFAVQSEIARRVVEAVGAEITRAEASALARPPTPHAEAYRFYLQGEEYLRRPGELPQNFRIAQGLYERSLRLDPGFALARARLSEVHGRMYWYGSDPSPERLRLQREEAEAALRLDPDLPQAHLAMGLVHLWERRDYRRALEELATARVGIPNDVDVLRFIAAVHRRLGNWEEALAITKRAQTIDPRSASLFYDLEGATYWVLRRYPEAVRAFEHALSIAPDATVAAVDKGWVYVVWRGELDTLRAVLRGLPSEGGLGLHLGGVTRESAELLLLERKPGDLLALLEASPSPVMETQLDYLPASLYAAWGHRLRGDQVAARAAFEASRMLLDSARAELPSDWRVDAALGLTLAGLGRREEALRSVRSLERSPVYSDAFFRPLVMEYRARIMAQAGDVDGALEEIEALLQGPSFFVTAHTLRMSPLWDPIREDTRFRALLSRYAEPRPVPAS